MKHTYTLITGASRGIGKELALLAAREGRNVILVARDKESLTKLARDLTKRYDIFAEVITADLTKPAASQIIYDTTKHKKLSVDILINNAGFGNYGAFDTSELPTQLNMIDLNVRVLTELTHLFLPELKSHKSAYILNIGSVASFIPGPFMSVYFATKAYVLSFSEALSWELRDSSVSVTCLCPGSTKTDFGRAARTADNHSTKTTKVSAQQVAEFGWKAMQNKRTVAIHGIKNRLLIVLTRLLPRRLTARTVAKIQSQ